MSGLREEIRAILREEFAALRPKGATAISAKERVRIVSNADLNQFARDLLARCSDPGFTGLIARGELEFVLAETTPVSGPIVSGPTRPTPDMLEKPLITERDIANLDGTSRKLRIGRHSRLTPLARDEARNRGIRIERIET